jgi:hypothetical protein
MSDEAFVKRVEALLDAAATRGHLFFIAWQVLQRLQKGQP